MRWALPVQASSRVCGKWGHGSRPDPISSLHTHPTLILLAQEGREQHSGLAALRERVRTHLGMDRLLHLVPPPNPAASEAEFFHALGRRAGMEPPAGSALAFEDYLDQRLTGGERLFLLVTDLCKGPDTGRWRLAASLRGLSDVHGDALRLVLAGGEGLAELKYAQGDLSLLSHGEPVHWPELDTGDLRALARRIRPPLDLAPEEASAILEATGSHPRLIQEALRCRAKGTALAECIRKLAFSEQIRSQLTAMTQDPADARRIGAWLEQEDLGPYQGWIPDPLLRRLYWKNLLRARGPVGAERLAWRCPAIIQAGRRVLASYFD
ncbi:MAG: hypothetical protein LGR52_00010 [Candidatus Thiosymbion ectosymbiont of Robbea hypermnestra]|nr:hypothetical protein [Candidatus Thiosymbion ectosymbiont of Robbea hypermnestra]